MTKEVFLGGIGLIKALAEDLPDGMWEAVKDQIIEIKNMLKRGREPDWDAEREYLDEVCHDYGLPSIFEKEGSE